MVSSNKPFARWGDDDDAAMIDGLVHHAEVIALKASSYRLVDRDLGRATRSQTDARPTGGGPFRLSPEGPLSAVVDSSHLA